MDLAAQLAGALTNGSSVALPLALAGGVISGFNPCCLALYPAVAGTCCAGANAGPRRGLPTALAFVLGIASSMALVGIAVALAGRVVGLGSIGRYVIAFVPLLMGLHLLGWLRIPLPRLPPNGFRASGAFSTGFLLSLIIGPCSTPIFASVLSYAAYQDKVAYSALLLFIYGVGAGMPLLLVGTAAGGLAQRLEAAGRSGWVDHISGILLLGLGLYLLWIA